MFTVEEICEEQERQYNQLMEEDDQYCHPESFKWGFEHGVEYALTKLGWHPASEPPKESGVYVVITDFYSCQTAIFAKYDKDKGWDTTDIDDIEWWCYLPKEE
jgi:hypothetical protein